MRIFATVVLFFFVLSSGLIARDNHIKGEFLLKIKDGYDLNIRNIPTGGEIKEVFLDKMLLKYNISNDSEEIRILNEIKEMDFVEYVDLNYVYRTQVYSDDLKPNDEHLSKQYGHKNISSYKAWGLSHASSVVVAVIDTGIDYRHPDLIDNIWINIKEIPGNGIDDDKNGFIDDVHGWDFVNNDNDPFDDNGHGTHCAGIIGAKGDNSIGVAGVNWNARIMALKFLDDRGSGTLDDAIKAIKYAVDNGALVLSNSWGGGGYSQAMYEVIKESMSRGALFVAAAGNAGSNNDRRPTYPASYDLDNVISVAATNERDSLAYFSNYGRGSVHVAAPGYQVFSTYPNGYRALSGTSMATPFVSGQAALMMEYKGVSSYAKIKEDIMKSVDRKKGLVSKIKSGGRINLYKSLSL